MANSAILPASQLATANITRSKKTMPNLANAKKALRQSDKRAQRNKIVRAEIHSMRVKLRKMIDAGNAKEAQTVAQVICKKLDKAEQKKVYKKNTVARYKSRLMKKVNAITKG